SVRPGERWRAGALIQSCGGLLVRRFTCQGVAACTSLRAVAVAAHPVAVFGVAHAVANGFLGRAGLVWVAVESAGGRRHHSLPQLGTADGIEGARPAGDTDARSQAV